MNESEARALLHRAREAITPGPPPIQQVMRTGQRLRTRRQLAQVSGAVVAVAAVVLAGMGWQPGSRTDTSPSPVTEPTLQTPPGNQVRIPDVVGLSTERAERRLLDVGLRVQWEYQPWDKPVCAAVAPCSRTVLEQSRAAGTEVEQGSAVTLVVPDHAFYALWACEPNGRGQIVLDTGEPEPSTSLDEAISRFVDRGAGEGFFVASQTDREAQVVVTRQDGRVIAYVDAHRWSNGGWAVDAITQCGDASLGQVTVPHVVGMPQQEADQILRESGLVPVVEHQPMDDMPDGTVTDQSPAAGTDVEEGSTVMLIVAGRANQASVVRLDSDAGAASAYGAFSEHTDSMDIHFLPSGASTEEDVLVSPEDEYAPDLASDGRSIVFAALIGGNAELYLTSVSGEEPVQLTEGPGTAGAPRWSPDGAMVAFWRESGDGRPQIHLLDVSTQQETQLTDTGFAGANPWWDESGDAILYSTHSPDGYALVEHDVATGEERVVTSVRNATAGAASSDGQYLAIRGGESISGPLLVIDRGSGAVVWRSEETFADIHDMSWDGDILTVVHGRDRNRAAFDVSGMISR